MIACSYDAKPFVKMGAPYFQIKDVLRQNGVVAFNSNYALYGDMSERVMTIIESMVPAVDTYSIDEAFADLTGIPGDLRAFGRNIRAAVHKRTGIPVGVVPTPSAPPKNSKPKNHGAKKSASASAPACLTLKKTNTLTAPWSNCHTPPTTCA